MKVCIHLVMVSKSNWQKNKELEMHISHILYINV